MIKYRKPPLVERAVGVYAVIDEEKFQRRLQGWADKLRQEFPHAETVTEWELKLTEKDGMPVMDEKGHKMTLRQRFWQTNEKGVRIRCIQLWRDRISFNLLENAGVQHRFEDLDQMTKQWLPKWAEEFDATGVSGVNLEYVNILSLQTVPLFATVNSINLNKLLTFYAAMPQQVQAIMPNLHPTVVPPYDFQVAIQGSVKAGSTETPLTFHAKLVGERKKTGVPIALRLTLSASTIQPKRLIPVLEATKELALTHDCAVRGFESLFTQEARQSFEPYDVHSTNSY